MILRVPDHEYGGGAEPMKMGNLKRGRRATDLFLIFCIVVLALITKRSSLRATKAEGLVNTWSNEFRRADMKVGDWVRQRGELEDALSREAAATSRCYDETVELKAQLNAKKALQDNGWTNEAELLPSPMAGLPMVAVATFADGVKYGVLYHTREPWVDEWPAVIAGASHLWTALEVERGSNTLSAAYTNAYPKTSFDEGVDYGANLAALALRGNRPVTMDVLHSAAYEAYARRLLNPLPAQFPTGTNTTAGTNVQTSAVPPKR